jgi:hypothetical protein
MRVLPLLAASLLLTGCGAGVALDSQQSAVRGGSPAPNDTNVVAVVNFAGGSCSGSLIAPNLVLTARHCVADTGGEALDVVCGRTLFEPADSAGAIFVVPQPTITEDPDDYAAVTAVRMPADQGDDLCGTDVVLLVLEKPLKAPTPLVPRLDEPVAPEEPYSSVGYGVDEDAEGHPSGERKRLDGLSVTCSGQACQDGDVKDNEWIGSGGPCSGDSGGPALDAENRVIGVVSRGKSGCSEPVFGDLSSRAAWLRSEAIAAANDARRAPPTWAPCSAETPCVSLASDDESSCSVRFGRTAPAAAWPIALAGLLLLARRRVSPKS